MKLKFQKAYFEYLVYIENRLKLQSKRTLIRNFENKILPYWKDYDIFTINSMDYLKWQNEIKKCNYSNNFNKNLHYLMTNFFEYCIKFYNIEFNIAKKVGPFKLKNEIKKVNFYTYKEFKKFIKKVDYNMFKQFFNFMFFTGARPGEAMALKFSDLSYKSISINKTIDEHHFKGVRHVTSPKTFTSIRNIVIDRKLYKDLLKLKKEYQQKYKLFDFDYYIFGGIKPLAPTTINRYKVKACEKAKVKVIKLHEFRHSHATLLVNKKIMINEISKRLGHSNVSTTLNIYTHTSKEQEKRVLNTLDFLRLF